MALTTSEKFIQFLVIDQNGDSRGVEIPLDTGMHLMDALIGAGFRIAGTCGGMALCATCHVKILKGAELLSPADEFELATLDILPDAATNSRLACQLVVSKNMNGMIVKLECDE